MNSQFKSEELVKVQGKMYPVVGGRLRLAHEDNEELSIVTEILEVSPERVTVAAEVTTKKGAYSGLGNASITRDAKLKNAILELAETRAIARALRFAGYGVEYTGYEEIGEDKSRLSVVQGGKDSEEEIEIDEKTKTIYELAEKKGFSATKVKKWVMENCKKSNVSELTEEEYKTLTDKLTGLPDKE